MGVCFVSVTATDTMIREVHNSPPLIWRLYAPEEEDLYLAEIGVGKKPNFVARLLGGKEISKPTTLPGFKYNDGERIEIDLDKSWDGINFCLKKILPTDDLNIFESGNPVGRAEVGYGPAMTFDSQSVRKLLLTYEAIFPSELVQQLNSSEMKKVYPKGIWKNIDIDTQEYVTENFELLQNYLRRASEKELGIVVVYT